MRPRRYVSRTALTLVKPLFRYSSGRDAYVMRLLGSHRGPVLREDRRRSRGDHDGYPGPERRGAASVASRIPHASPQA